VTELRAVQAKLTAHAGDLQRCELALRSVEWEATPTAAIGRASRLDAEMQEIRRLDPRDWVRTTRLFCAVEARL
jgi:hypothetical protein